MIDYDSDFLSLPLVSFCVDLPDLHPFKVTVPMHSAARDEYLQYFDLIQTPDNKPLFRALGFFAFCSMFTLIGKEGFELRYEPYEWFIDRDDAIKNPHLSLDLYPATGLDAWAIYTAYQDKNHSDKAIQTIERLEANKVAINHIKKHLPGLIECFKNKETIYQGFDKDRFERAVCQQALSYSPIKKRNREKIKDIDLLQSYWFILKSQPGTSSSDAMKKAVKLKFPSISDDELHQRQYTLKALIRDTSKKSSIINKLKYLFPDND